MPGVPIDADHARTHGRAIAESARDEQVVVGVVAVHVGEHPRDDGGVEIGHAHQPTALSRGQRRKSRAF